MPARTVSPRAQDDLDLDLDLDLELVARVRVAIARLNRQLRQQSGDGLSPTLQSALVSIEKQGPLSLGELAAIERVAPATVTKIVGKLVDQGLIERTPDPDDRRVTLVALSAGGAKRLAESRNRRNAFLATRLDQVAIDADRLESVVDVLETIASGDAP